MHPAPHKIRHCNATTDMVDDDAPVFGLTLTSPTSVGNLALIHPDDRRTSGNLSREPLAKRIDLGVERAPLPDEHRVAGQARAPARVALFVAGIGAASPTGKTLEAQLRQSQNGSSHLPAAWRTTNNLLTAISATDVVIDTLGWRTSVARRGVIVRTGHPRSPANCSRSVEQVVRAPLTSTRSSPDA